MRCKGAIATLKKINNEIKRDRKLLLILICLLVYGEGCFIFASFKGDINEMEVLAMVIAFLPCIYVFAFALLTVIRQIKESEIDNDDSEIPQLTVRSGKYLLFSLLTALICFLCCCLNHKCLSVNPDIISQMKDIIRFLLQFYTGIKVSVSLWSLILFYFLLTFSVFLFAEAFSFTDMVMRFSNVCKTSRILAHLCFFSIGCLAIKTIWSLQIILVLKVMFVLILWISVLIASQILFKRALNRYILPKK